MFRNYLAAALRNLARNKLYAGVTIVGLAIGFAASILIGLYVRDELTYDNFVPGVERTYLVAETLAPAGSKPIRSATTPIMLAEPLALDFPEIEAVARLSPSYFPPTVKHGLITASEQNFFWGDPAFFRVMPLPVLAGDLSTALEPSDGLVITRSIARKYFGKDAPLGEVLMVEGHPFRITAVLRDLPSNTHLTAELIASSRAPSGPIAQNPYNGPLVNTLATYFRLKPGASTGTMQPRLEQFLDARLPLTGMRDVVHFDRTLHLIPVRDLHMADMTQGMVKPPADAAVILAIGVVGVLIVAVAAINFVTLMTARASRRAVEVGVRKAAGATRGHLMIQFMGEVFVYVLAAGVLALSLAELLLPLVSALLQRKLTMDYLHDPLLAGSVFGLLLLTSLLAGAYPAFVLSGFKPASVLKGGPVASAGSARVRQALVIGQFAVLVGLVLVAITIARQTVFALNDGLRVDNRNISLVFFQPCLEPFRDEVRKLPGVRDAACASYQALAFGDVRDTVPVNGRKVDVSTAPVDFGFLEAFGIRPLAGRLFDRRRPADGALGSPDINPPVVLNETAVRILGFGSPAQAIGKTVVWRGIWDDSLRREGAPAETPAKPSEVIGVIPDFTLGSMRQPIRPTVYSIGRNLPPSSIGMVIKMDGPQTPEIKAGVERLWKRFGNGKPMTEASLERVTLRLYVDTLIQGATVAVAGLIALTVAALGLFALSAFTTERRIKEIGVRKAMGASSGDILKLLLWQFAKPVLWANLIAWPAAWLILNWWLSSFAYHVDIAPWTFAAAGAGALLIALATVFVHALNVSRAKPVGALRYE